ncbi:unnamed protein product [Nezara viridula]|uniref:Uncharacterized protein n=1 Tax=Nezara viridula TaxID=85310 RepID=A0A9P0HEP7_NEZVI|nr:unnamed protein product [Nezara viridula]
MRVGMGQWNWIGNGNLISLWNGTELFQRLRIIDTAGSIRNGGTVGKSFQTCSNSVPTGSIRSGEDG